jgi:RHS repeat-associated protein
VTRPSDNKQVWTWFSDPFGTTLPNQNPAGAGSFAYNLRFPGQVFDGQAGLHQNRLRDYDPAIARYVESDPIGLWGGSYSTYTYAGGSSLKYIDPRGTDVRVETTNAVYGFHEHISVDTPDGPYSISFGMNDRNDPQQGSTQASGVDPQNNGDGSGIVYEDPDSPTATVEALHTTAAQDRWIEQFLRQQVGRRGPYNVATNSCRTFSNNQFNSIRDKVEGNWWQRLLNNILSLGGLPAY